MKIAIIPARAGSKRIPNKNIRPFCGKPIIAWSIEAAVQSKLFDKIIVSTDSQSIADIAMQYGAEVPFMRPASLSDDHTPTRLVVNDVIQWLIQHKYSPEYICCIYATAPFVTGTTLNEAWSQLIADNSDFCFSVTTFAYPTQKALSINNNKIVMIAPQFRLTRTQDLPQTYHDAGQFYWGKANAFINNHVMYSDCATAYFIPRYKTQDIDTEEDWLFAEQLFKEQTP